MITVEDLLNACKGLEPTAPVVIDGFDCYPVESVKSEVVPPRLRRSLVIRVHIQHDDDEE